MGDRAARGRSGELRVAGRRGERGFALRDSDHRPQPRLAADHREAAHEAEGDSARRDFVGDAPVAARVRPGALRLGGQERARGAGVARVHHERAVEAAGRERQGPRPRPSPTGSRRAAPRAPAPSPARARTARHAARARARRRGRSRAGESPACAARRAAAGRGSASRSGPFRRPARRCSPSPRGGRRRRGRAAPSPAPRSPGRRRCRPSCEDEPQPASTSTAAAATATSTATGQLALPSQGVSDRNASALRRRAGSRLQSPARSRLLQPRLQLRRRRRRRRRRPAKPHAGWDFGGRDGAGAAVWERMCKQGCIVGGSGICSRQRAGVEGLLPLLHLGSSSKPGESPQWPRFAAPSTTRSTQRTA